MQVHRASPHGKAGPFLSFLPSFQLCRGALGAPLLLRRTPRDPDRGVSRRTRYGHLHCVCDRRRRGAAIAVGTFAYWIATRRRIAAETIGRAERMPRRILRDAERDAEARKKEALLEAKDAAHDLRQEAERQAQERRQQLGRDRAGPRQEGGEGRRAAGRRWTSTRRTSARGSRLCQGSRAGDGRRGGPLRGAGRGAAARAAARRRASPPTKPGRSLLKQIEADARRDAANLVKRLETEARETAAARAKRLVDRGHPAQRCRARHRNDGVGGRPAERRSQGADHRPRGAQHPRARDRDRRRPDRRRHAGGDHPVGIRSVPARDRQAGDRAADRRRPHPSGADRGGGREGARGDRRDACARKARPPRSSSGSTTCTPRSTR